ncbi:MAG: hypothetical protein ACJA1A_002796 [Saprospiraceae bacterium]|jgi:hypothetical protein
MAFLKRITIVAISIFIFFQNGFSQNPTSKLINELKEDLRGPYKDIKWFCEDGSIREARDPCPEPMEGVQHARYKDNIQKMADDKGIYLDQILIGTDKEKFWNENEQNSRLKQYQITNFLYEADNGWILEKAKNYRGAKQIEDEQKWGQEFLEWVVADDKRLRENFLLIRMAAEDIPHGEDNRVSQRVRAYSKLLADSNSKFMETRIKIHNSPSPEDIALSKAWASKNKMSAQEQEYYDLLQENMAIMHRPFDIEEINRYVNYLPKDSDIKANLQAYVDLVMGAPQTLRAMETSQMLKTIRDEIFQTKWSEARVKLIDLSNHLEDILMKDIVSLNSSKLPDLRDNLCYLSDALYGAGYLESWEYTKARDDMDWLSGRSVSLANMDDYRFASQKLVQWSTQMVQSLYAEPMRIFHDFEPLVDGFTDDKIRSSIILQVGYTVEKLNELFNNTAQAPSSIMKKENLAGLQGLNPGYAKGELVVIEQATEDMDLDANKIYAFDRPPADLKPVAGILNVKEGNPVSHVQLLARNLAIPNGLISSDVLSSLKEYNGSEVFYAVSPKGTLILKLVDDMTKQEKELFKSKQADKKRIRISTDKLIFDADSLLNMSEIGASVSGKWCGPKAANLGQLKQLFPDHVVEGVVIPFGVFKDHMMQTIPGRSASYWDVLKNIFAQEVMCINDGMDRKIIEHKTLSELGNLRYLIEKMPLKKSLVDNLEGHFRNTLGARLGDIPVFLRSDTNMEDLPEFTGAGLNLTLFNVLDRQEILDGIKKVWASPYTERSYQWRQQYLDNPEDVYPSILIIPSVNVDKSGVIITKGVSRGGEDDISISFSRGVGGAVDGQSAESYVIKKNGYSELINPGRETKYRVIPSTGGSTYSFATFTESVLSDDDRTKLRQMAIDISNKMDKVTGGHGPYDIELGIKGDKIWLFQVRPFVENKSAVGSDYLKSLDPVYENKYLILDEY